MKFKKKSVSIYYCTECGTEFGQEKPIFKCTHPIYRTCGLCMLYNSSGFCEHRLSLDSCADRDSDAICDINCFKPVIEE